MSKLPLVEQQKCALKILLKFVGHKWCQLRMAPLCRTVAELKVKKKWRNEAVLVVNRHHGSDRSLGKSIYDIEVETTLCTEEKILQLYPRGMFLLSSTSGLQIEAIVTALSNIRTVAELKVKKKWQPDNFRPCSSCSLKYSFEDEKKQAAVSFSYVVSSDYIITRKQIED
ncbi:hypothetical protein E3N88_07868 [Mikania micrantha]|uniref:Uncharacterized protein n=1 Tax=Mikania micrantha TaxID=192012 RepID=A0A5N6PGP9_9ASTR|nr:hypothetical protein E3N88_07868 [Mikania micrantha]